MDVETAAQLSVGVTVTYAGPGKYSMCGTVNDTAVAVGTCPAS